MFLIWIEDPSTTIKMNNWIIHDQSSYCHFLLFRFLRKNSILFEIIFSSQATTYSAFAVYCQSEHILENFTFNKSSQELLMFQYCSEKQFQYLKDELYVTGDKGILYDGWITWSVEVAIRIPSVTELNIYWSVFRCWETFIE